MASSENTEERLRAALADRYHVEREIGRGGMATVYLAGDRKHHRKVAVKVLHPELAVTLGGERFLREIRVTANLQHPHILGLYDSGEADGALFYVMPYVDGESLRDRLRRETQLPTEDALRITEQIASALDFAHRHDVIHRDIKPENILLYEGEAMVADFGIALAVTAAGGERLTETGLSIGTPEYMSPEQIAGERTIDARSDIYSLACVLYEMLAGQPPFTAATAQAVLARHLTDPVPTITTVRPGVSPPMAAALTMALGKAPADRFSSAAAFAEGLRSEAVGVEEKSIVVLPFENLSPDPDNEYFADGLTEELITELSTVRSLRVISRTTAMKLKDSDKDVGAIARDLDVQYVLEGSVRKAGDALRITAQLVDATKDAHLWAERYSGTMDDVFEIQERLARTIVDQLKVELTPEEKEDLVKGRPANTLAYECYLRAKQLMAQFTSDAIQRAIEILEKAIEAEGPNELLYTTMGLAHTRFFVLGIRRDEALFAKAEEWAAKVLEMNPNSAGASVIRGSVLFHQGRVQESVVQCKKALGTDPGNTDALFHLTYAAGCSGYIDVARSYLRERMRVDPRAEGANPSWFDYYDGRFEAAVSGYRLEYEIDPDSPYTMWAYGNVLIWAGDTDEGCALYDQLVERFPRTAFASFARFTAAAIRKERDRALEAMTPELEAVAGADIQLSWMIAAGYAQLGLVRDAMDWLRRAVGRGFISYPFLSEQEPFLAPIRSEPEFQELMHEVKRRWEAFEP
jgi:serine/threonine-protein kinase